jgi:hypothetical protein
LINVGSFGRAGRVNAGHKAVPGGSPAMTGP